MYFEHIHSPQLFLFPLSIPPLPTYLEATFCPLTWSPASLGWDWGLPWHVVSLAGVTLNRTDSPCASCYHMLITAQLEVRLRICHHPSVVHVLYMLSPAVFVCVQALLCLENTLSLTLSAAFGSSPLLWLFPSFCPVCHKDSWALEWSVSSVWFLATLLLSSRREKNVFIRSASQEEHAYSLLTFQVEL